MGSLPQPLIYPTTTYMWAQPTAAWRHRSAQRLRTLRGGEGVRKASSDCPSPTPGARLSHPQTNPNCWLPHTPALHSSSVRRGRGLTGLMAPAPGRARLPLHGAPIPFTQTCLGTRTEMFSCHQRPISGPSFRSPPSGRPPGSGISPALAAGWQGRGSLEISSQMTALPMAPKAGSSVAGAISHVTMCPSAWQGTRHPG